MRIGELADRSGVSPRALRHYEQSGLLPARRRDNGYREYDESAVLRVGNIRALLDAGLNTDQIRELTACLDERLDHVPACAEAISLHERRLRTVQAQIAALTEVENSLTGQLARLRAGHAPR